MTEIRAFVGHSFAEEDEALVGKFLRYFEEIRLTKTDFFLWENAKRAEPREVSTKVFNRFKNKNAFIAICTKQEKVVGASNLRILKENQKKLNGEEPIFEWTTSDWVIQEIGVAMGMGLHMILLKESGIRNPGTLQADLEYIEFDREVPERSFVKILQMINDIAPKVSNVVPTSPEQITVKSEATALEEANHTDKHEIDASWMQRDYEIALMLAMHNEDTARFEEIESAYRKSEFFASIDSNGWEAWKILAAIITGKGGSLSALKKFVESGAKSARNVLILARGYGHHGLNLESAKEFEKAALLESDPERAMRAYSEAAKKYALDDNIPAFERIVDTMRALPKSEAADLLLLETINSLGETLKDNDVRIASMERILEIVPDDDDIRFNLGFAYSESENNESAAYNYDQIRLDRRSSSAWHNLGVAYSLLDLPVHCVESYRRAIEEKGTLASSNLALKYLSEGFVQEAELCIQEAMKIESYDKNVASTLARIREARDEENLKIEEIQKSAKSARNFYRSLGRAFSMSPNSNFAGRWQGPVCELEITLLENQFNAEGIYKHEHSDLASALFPGPNSLRKQTPSLHRIVYKGIVRGSAIVGTVNRVPKDRVEPPSTLLGKIDDPKVLMYISDAGDAIRVLERSTGGSSRQYELKRIKLVS